MRVLIAPSAARDIDAIHEYISQDSPRSALAVSQQLEQACVALGDWPQSYPVVGRFDGAEVRRRPVGAYAVLYAILSDRVEIVRILHAARDMDALLGDPS